MSLTHGKSLVANSFFNVCYQLLNVLFPLVTSAYVSRVLMPDGIGKVALAQNWAQYFVVFAALGIPNYGIREIARSRTDSQQLKKLSRSSGYSTASQQHLVLFSSLVQYTFLDRFTATIRFILWSD